MLKSQVVRRTIDHLRKPFVQRLITLVVSMLLAMCLGYATMVMARPTAGHEVAMSHVSSQPSRLPLGAARMQAFTLTLCVSGPLTAHLTRGQHAERRRS